MSLQEIENMDIEEHEKVVAERRSNLVAIAGGKPPSEGDWLAHIKVGVIFVSKRKDQTFLLSLFRVCYNEEGVAVLEVLSEEGQKLWVDTEAFSQFNKFKKIIDGEQSE